MLTRAVSPRWIELVLSVCLIGLVPASADAQRWTHASSDHFEVYTTGGERRARSALTYFERVHGFFEDFLQLAPKQKHPTRLIVFSSDREFAPYRFNEIATAYYLAGPDRDYIVMRSLDAESYPLVVHEYAHLIMRHSGVNYPRWLNEGLAEFFSTLAPQGGQMSLGRVPMGRLMELREGDRMLDLPRLFAVDHNSAEYNTRSHAGTFYAQSWALTHMLMTADGYRQGVGRFLNAVSGGQPSGEALEAVYGRPLAQVFSDLSAYVRSDRFAFFSAKYRDPRDEAGYATRVVAPFEVGLVTAALLADAPGRLDDARTAYDALLAERPDDPEVLGARGYLELRRGDRVAAAGFLQKAVAAKSQNAALHHWAATFATSNEERESLLARGVALDPDNVDIRLAYVGTLVNQQRPEAAFDALVPVTRVTPEQAFSFFELKALIAVQLDHLDEARIAATSARQYASAGVQADAADRLVRTIAEFATRRAEAERLNDNPGATPAPGPAAAPAPASVPERNLSLNGRLVSMAAGRFRNLDCSGEPRVMEVVADNGTTIRLLIDDPGAIRVEGANGPTTDLSCGSQDRSVQVGFLPGADAARRTVGLLRLIRFR
jgi:hypothetical protein